MPAKREECLESGCTCLEHAPWGGLSGESSHPDAGRCFWCGMAYWAERFYARNPHIKRANLLDKYGIME